MSLSNFCVEQRERETQQLKFFLAFSLVGSALFHAVALTLGATIPWQQVLEPEAEPMEIVVVEPDKLEEEPEIEEIERVAEQESSPILSRLAGGSSDAPSVKTEDADSSRSSKPLDTRETSPSRQQSESTSERTAAEPPKPKETPQSERESPQETPKKPESEPEPEEPKKIADSSQAEPDQEEPQSEPKPEEPQKVAQEPQSEAEPLTQESQSVSIPKVALPDVAVLANPRPYKPENEPTEVEKPAWARGSRESLLSGIRNFSGDSQVASAENSNNNSDNSNTTEGRSNTSESGTDTTEIAGRNERSRNGNGEGVGTGSNQIATGETDNNNTTEDRSNNSGSQPDPTQVATRRNERSVEGNGESERNSAGLYCRDCPAPTYPSQARRRGVEGTARVTFDIDENGRPTNIQLATSSGNRDIDKATLEAVKDWRLDPSAAGRQGVTATNHFEIQGSQRQRQRLEQERRNREAPSNTSNVASNSSENRSSSTASASSSTPSVPRRSTASRTSTTAPKPRQVFTPRPRPAAVTSKPKPTRRVSTPKPRPAAVAPKPRPVSRPRPRPAAVTPNPRRVSRPRPR
ncbi:MAG TPA: hypothetical protein DCY91_23185, partial [Cyanobacteria bacterium UBA11370]|nr:hypothetical protein [Cyanobacteria bacterium UBA11370]